MATFVRFFAQKVTAEICPMQPFVSTWLLLILELNALTRGAILPEYNLTIRVLFYVVLQALYEASM